METFKTYAEAEAAGYRRCHARYGDVDTSGPNSLGYSYRAQDGRESVTVRLSNVENKGGAVGAYVEMMPLAPDLTPEDERVAAYERRAEAERRWHDQLDDYPPDDSATPDEES